MAEFDPIAYINEPRWQESRLGLERIGELLERMGRPQDRLKFVHVAGTNGKGSTCAYIASILKEAGYTTGLFTSPYIIEFEERIRVNGQNISAEDLKDVTLFVRDHAEAMADATGEHPTEFELMTAVAFEHFARSSCDIVVCEVGLGGRLDSTNIIASPEVCAITRIGLDHTEYLGDTLAAVAAEKAGIIKSASEVVMYPQDSPEAAAAILVKAAECGCNVSQPDFAKLSIGGVALDTAQGVAHTGVRHFEYDGLACSTRLLGSYQAFNAAMAVEVARTLRTAGWIIGDDAITAGIANAAWPARFEVVQAGSGCAAVVVDGGHNPQGAAVLAESLENVFPGKRIVLVMSVLADKDYREMIRIMAPVGQAWVCVPSPHVGRALSGSDLARVVREELAGSDDAAVRAASVDVASDFPEAMEKARQLAGLSGVVCAFGSLYSVAEIKKALARTSLEP